MYSLQPVSVANSLGTGWLYSPSRRGLLTGGEQRTEELS
jgi:hypothetical protein